MYSQNYFLKSEEEIFSDDFETLVNKINSWKADHNTVQNLRDMISELKGILTLDAEIFDHVDLYAFPTYPLDDYLDNPKNGCIWAVDFNGNCLVGELADEIVTVEHVMLNSYHDDVDGVYYDA